MALARRGFRRVRLTPPSARKRARPSRLFSVTQNLPATGPLDTNTRARLTLDAPLLTNYVVTTNDLARLQPLGKTWLAKSEQSALDYETDLELVAEKSHSHPVLIQKLNPGVNWTNVAAGHGFENSRRELSGAGGQGGVCGHPFVGQISGGV